MNNDIIKLGSIQVWGGFSRILAEEDGVELVIAPIVNDNHKVVYLTNGQDCQYVSIVNMEGQVNEIIDRDDDIYPWIKRALYRNNLLSKHEVFGRSLMASCFECGSPATHEDYSTQPVGGE